LLGSFNKTRMKRKLLLCLLSFTFLAKALPSDTIKNELYAWKLLNCYLVEPANFDTTISEFHILNQIERHSWSNSTLGTIGTPWKSNVYASWADIPRSDFYWDKNYHYNLLTTENQLYYHSKKPFFDLAWTSAPKKRNENQLSALYTQNVNKKWNIGARYKLIAGGGEYPRAVGKQNSVNFFTSYQGEKYTIHAAFIRNKIVANENGGVEVDANDPNFNQPFIESASSGFYNRIVYISQQYKFGFNQKIVLDDTTTISNFKEAGRLNYIIRFDNNYRFYTDGNAKSGFYDTAYINQNKTFDSTYMSRFENTLYWSFKEIDKENFKGRLTIGGTYEILKLSMLDKTDTVYQTNPYNNMRLFGNLSARTKSFVFNVEGQYFLKGQDGYKQNDHELNALISKDIQIFKLKTSFYSKLAYRNYSPQLFLQSYRSNHFRWENSFQKIVESNLKFGVDIHKLNVQAEVLFGTVGNYIYFGNDATPKQHKPLLNILSASLNKTFNLGLFKSVNKVVYQIPTNNEILRLPQFVAYHSFFLDKRFDDIQIQVQFGYDLNYSSRYRANAYMPATGVFYLSDNVNTGHYPFANAFLKLRIKTVLLFLKWEHVNNNFLLDKYYYQTENYPVSTSAFKFGVSWRFMD
jgi:hypothetical protein